PSRGGGRATPAARGAGLRRREHAESRRVEFGQALGGRRDGREARRDPGAAAEGGCIRMTAHSTASSQLADLWAALGGAAEQGEAAFTGQGSLPSKYPVTSFAAASIASGGVAIAELLDAAGESRPAVTVDRALAGAWFGRVNRAIGWEHAEGSSLTGEYQAADGRWLRLQMNYPRPRDRMLAALGCAPDRSAVAAAIGALPSLEVEDLLAEAGGAAAIARTTDEWAAHPQGIAREGEQLVDVDDVAGEDSSGWRPLPGRPLAGIRVLDMTRV